MGGMTAAAFSTFGAAQQSVCEAYLTPKYATNKGEDVYAERCLRHLRIPSFFADGLLQLVREGQPDDISQVCYGHLSYHSIRFAAFKTPEQWLQCYDAAFASL